MPLEVRGLDLSFLKDGTETRVLRGVDLTVEGGEIHALVGESGAGKTVTASAVMGLLPFPSVRINGGGIFLDSVDILRLPRRNGGDYGDGGLP